MSDGILAKIKAKLAVYALGAAVLVIGVPAYLGGKHMLAEPAGTTCEAKTRCRGNGILSSGMCLAGEGEEPSYCTHECSGASDCTSGMSCEPVEGTWTTETTRGNHATQVRTSQGTKMVCVKSP